MDSELAQYIVRYYGHLMTKDELLAHRHLMGTAKTTHGRTDARAQSEARAKRPQFKDLFSDSPAVLELAQDGMEAFVERTAERLMREHAEQIFVNRCLRCGKLARTPRARQCRYCHYSWHNEP